MENPQFLLPLIFLFFLHPITATPTIHPDFIRTSCATTLYPELCYASLSRFTNAIQSNPTRLARAAIAVSLANARRTTAYLASLKEQADPQVAGPLQDCSSNFEDAVDEISDSFGQMKTLWSGAGSVRFQLSNVQTWMSAALTDVETCTDGFEDVDDGPIKTDVVNRADFVKKVTSIALAMVNYVANNSTPP